MSTAGSSPAGAGETGADDGRTPDSGAADGTTGIPDRVRVAIGLGVALLVALLVALGLEGDVRSRFIRNSPDAVWIAFALVIVGVSLPLVAHSATRSTSSRLRTAGVTATWVGVLLLVAGAIAIVRSGAVNIAVREQPDIAVSARAAPDPAFVDVTVEATALSLASRDRMLVRVVTVAEGAAAWLDHVCRQPGRPGEELRSIPPQEQRTLVGRQAVPAETVMWAESGPLANGDADSTTRIRVDRSAFRYVCVFAALTSTPSSGSGRLSDTDRFSVAITDLAYAPGDTAPAETTSAETTSAETVPPPAGP